MSRYETDPSDDLLFERLADGELRGDEYRRLIATLDDRPGGWKRCALALLEAQALSGELRCAVRDMSAADPSSSKTRAKVIAHNVHPGTLVLAVAASFLIALGLGVWLRGGFTIPGEVAEHGRPNNAVTTDNPETAGAPATDRAPDEANLISDDSGILPRGRMTLLVDDGSGGGDEIQLPVYDESQFDASWLAPHQVSQEELQSLRQRGYDVLRDRQMVPFELDGHQVLVPMEQVEIVPVSTTYQ